jgi:hypothetical protein
MKKDEVQDWRGRGDLLGALHRLREIIERDASFGARLWRRHVLGARCLLLDAARRHPHGGQTLGAIQDLCRAAKSLLGLPLVYGDLLNARRAILEAALDDRLGPQQIERSLADAVQTYEKCWGLALGARFHARGAEPALMQRFPNDRTRELLDGLADRFGWWHPGLLLVAETFLALCPPYRVVEGQTEPEPLPKDHDVQTWVLLVGGTSAAADGIPGQLHVERVPGGCGAVYPHPLAGGHLWTKSCFQKGLEHSRLAALRQVPRMGEFDIRWWIDLTDPTPAW